MNLDDIYETLFENSYFQLDQPDTNIIAVAAYGNKILIAVKDYWRDHAKFEISEYYDAFPHSGQLPPGHTGPSMFMCFCYQSPTVTSTGECHLESWFLFQEFHRPKCRNDCNQGCVITKIDQ